MPTLFYLTECTSTNDLIQTYIPENEKGIISLYTFQQTRGRGTYGNVWESASEKNIAFSSAIPCEIFKEGNTHITIWTAIVVRNLLAEILQKNVDIKWPNDLIIRKKKISGTLIEKKKIHQRSYYILGIGINILQEGFSSLPQAGSIFTETGIRLNLHDFAQQLHTTLVHESQNISPLAELLSHYNEHLFLRKNIAVFETATMRQNGTIQYVDENGKLVVELENEGLHAFYHKEIKMLY